MPICEADPWRLQYFTHVDTAADIPTEDSDAWQWYPAHRFVYDKLKLALSQNLEAAPHGVAPPRYPVFSKPMVNLRGMGVGSRVLTSQADYLEHYAPGHFWMTLLEGRHVSSDVAVVDGAPCWWRHVTGKPAGEGTFDYWIVHAEPDPGIETRCGAWIKKNLAGYTGMLNLETIGETIIEAHLRFSDQWPDLYGPGWVDAVVTLYETGEWDFADDDRCEGYSVVLFVPYGRRYRHPPQALVEDVRAIPGIASVQITFHEDRPPELHAMPPGGFRVAIVNGFDLRAALAGRERLKDFFSNPPAPGQRQV
ncbi:MAG TPA: hypothetical protein VHX43_19450 [Xanthobacteraceae bacterium]|jgi:hypothetical protein|nr:hypothetical protein [Xanthobacteraceae bacterium]